MFEQVGRQADLRQFVAEHLSSIGNGYECPACHSGTGPDHSPAFSIMPDGKRWKCFACDKAGDVFDLYGILNETEDKREQLEGVARWAGIPLDPLPPRSTAFGWDDEVETADAPTTTSAKASATGGDAESTKSTAEGTEAAAAKAGKNKPVPIYWSEREARSVEQGRKQTADYVESCRANVENPACVTYLNGRGCSLEIAKRHGLGYDPAHRRITIPYPGAQWYYTGRDVTGKAGNRYAVPSTAKVGEGAIWDADALAGPVVFIVEGQFDAIAVAECGGRAICANGTKDLKRVAGAAAKHPRCFLYLLFDADEKGREECDAFLLELERLGAYSFDGVEVIRCPYPDPWEWFAIDPEGMRAEVSRLIAAVPTDEERFTDFAKSLAPEHGDVAEWLDGSEPLSTGIDSLDAALGGGLYSGLHILAAPPGAGKSSLAIQIALNVAIMYKGVLYISLEMPRADVVARCAAYISKTFEDEGREQGQRDEDGFRAFTFAEFESAGAELARKSGGDMDRVRELAAENPKAYGMLELLKALPNSFLYRLAIADGRDGTLGNVAGVVDLMKRAAREGCSLVVIDYLQYIDAGKSAGVDDKAERDGYVAKRLTEAAKHLDLKVLALSSVTKSEGGKSATEADPFSAKGSSDIGHDAVTVMRLEHKPEQMPAGNSVLVLKVAKNRKGASGGVVELEFLAGYATVRSISQSAA